MAKETISRCDECGAVNDVQEFRITYGGETREVDLCPDHGGPLLALFEKGAKVGQRPASKGRARSAHAVVPIEEWQQGQ